MNDSRFRLPATLIFAAALALRFAHLWSMRKSPLSRVLLGDARAYDLWAQQIAGGDWLGRDVFYQAPLYAYFVGALYTIRHSLTLVRACQAVIGASACALVGYAAHRLFGKSAGLVAGLMLACYAPSIFFDGLVQKSVLDVFFICLLLALLSGPLADPEREHGRWRWPLIGVTLGALGLTRENALLFVPVIVGWIWLDSSQRARHASPRTAMLLAGLSIVLLPVGVRNLLRGGEFHLTTTQSGPNLFIGNNAEADGTYVPLRAGRGSPEYERLDATEIASRAAGRALSPGEVSDYWIGRALDYIRMNPRDWLALEARKLRLLTNVTEAIDTESQESYEDESPPLRLVARVAHFGVLLPLACLGIWMTSREPRRVSLLYAMICAYVLSLMAFYVVARYRLPLVPLLIIIAAAAVVGGRKFLTTLTPLGAIAGAAGLVTIAIVCNRPAMAADTMRAATYHNLGAALQEASALDEAAAAYRRALIFQPDYAPSQNGLGSVLLQQDKFDEAVSYLETAVRLRPDAADVHANLGIALSRTDRLDEAIDHFRTVVALAPETAKAHYNLGHSLLTRGRLGDAIVELSRAVEIDPTDGSARYELGNAYLAQQRFAEAIEQFHEAVRLSPGLAERHNNLGIALGSAGRLDEAIAEFGSALQIDPGSREAQANRNAALAARRAGK